MLRDQEDGTEVPGISSTTVTIPYDHHGVELMFKVMAYAETEDLFFKA